MCIRDRNTFQHPPIKRNLPDVMDLAGTRIALVIGADEMVLRLILVSITGTVIELCTAIGTVDKLSLIHI